MAERPLASQYSSDNKRRDETEKPEGLLIGRENRMHVGEMLKNFFIRLDSVTEKNKEKEMEKFAMILVKNIHFSRVLSSFRGNMLSRFLQGYLSDHFERMSFVDVDPAYEENWLRQIKILASKIEEYRKHIIPTTNV